MVIYLIANNADLNQQSVWSPAPASRSCRPRKMEKACLQSFDSRPPFKQLYTLRAAPPVYSADAETFLNILKTQGT